MQLKLTTASTCDNKPIIEEDLLNLHGNDLLGVVSCHLDCVKKTIIQLGLPVSSNDLQYNMNHLGLDKDGFGWDITANKITFACGSFTEEYTLI